METLTLVIIEDEEAHFSLMKRAIVKDLPNAAVYHFQEPGSCLERLPEIMPAIIITDYLMPGMNGIEFITALNQEHIDIPVVMITGQGDESVAARAMKLGAKDYLVKSGNFFALLPSVIQKVISEKKISDSLREVEEKYRLVIENAAEGIVVIQDGMLKFCNPKMTDILGYTHEERIARPFVDFVYPADKQMVIERSSNMLSSDKKYEMYDFRIIDKNLNIKWLRNHEVVVDWGNRPAILSFLTDITDFKSADEKIRNLSQMLLQTQERERHMISYELHDRIGQNLSMLKIGCDMLLDDQAAVSPELRAKTAKLSKLTEQTIADIRNLAYDLRPPGLDELGLLKALEIYCEEFSENSGVKIDFQSAGMQTLDPDLNTAIHLYRLVQEGLNNIRKHAAADQATIKLIGSAPNIILRIEDNGKGFDVQVRKQALDNEKRMGLRSMQERANLLQGQMTIQSRAMQGTKIFIKFPFKAERSDS